MKLNSNALRNWMAVIAAAMFVVCGLTLCQAQSVVWSENFELGWGDWYEEGAGGAAWAVGSPASGPPLNAQGARAYAGTNCAATGLSAAPAAHVDTRLVSPPFDVPATNQNPRLRFWHWFDLATGPSDQAWVEISVNSGNWATISPIYYGSSAGSWTRPSLDLVAYAGQSVRLAFHYRSSATPHRGWFLDEVLIETNPFPPGITQGPSSLVVTQGQTAVFAVLATGSAPLYYQWSLNLTNLANGGCISGADNSALLITDVQAGDAGLYSVVVSNSVGATSANATLTVLVPPYIITPPQGQTVLAGSDVTFTVIAGGTSPLAYQWQFNGSNLLNQTAASLTLSNVQSAQTGNYTVVVSNVINVISATAPLNVLHLPFPWASDDIGDVAARGSAVYSNGLFTVTGSGEDIQGTEDAFQFVHQSLTGDGQIVARFLALRGGDPQLAEAGVMIRESLDAGSKHAFLRVNANTNVLFRRRLAFDDYNIDNTYPGMNDCWLRLMRLGNTFVALCSTNGLDWDYVWFTTMSLSNQVQAGLAVTAHHRGELATAAFDNVTVGALNPLTGLRPQPPRICLGGEPLGLAGHQVLGGFKMLLAGDVGDWLVIKATRDFASWADLSTVTNLYGVVDFLDTQALTNTYRFYRAQRVGP